MLGIFVILAVAAAIIIAGGTVALLWQMRYPPRKTFAVALGRGLPTDPTDLQLEAEGAIFSLADGSQTPGWLIAGQHAEGPIVLVVHGFGDSRYGAMTWAPLFLPFAAQIVVFDQRGHGDAQSPASGLGVCEVDDLLGLLEQLPSAKAVVLFGYSLGAGVGIAAAAAVKQSKRCPIVGVIADGPYRYWQEPVAAILRAKGYPRQPFMFLAGVLLRLKLPGIGRFDRVCHARRLRCPLLVLHGRADEVCPFASGRAIADAAPQGKLVAFDDAAHTQLASTDPVRYRDALAAFFAQLAEIKSDESGRHD